VELAWKPEAAGDCGHSWRDEVVEVAVGGSGQAESLNADVVKSLIVEDDTIIDIFQQTRN
jgi:hypothetical protein